MSIRPPAGLENVEPVPAIGAMEIRAIAEILRESSGITLSEEREDFVRVRLGKRLRSLGHNTFASYLRYLRGPSGRAERKHLVEAMTTHTTGFFREIAHFEWMRQTALPDLLAKGAGKERPMVIWSAACSIGAELWSAGMVVDRFSRETSANLRFELLGSDISQTILRRAAASVFTAEDITGMPDEMRKQYLLRARKPIDGISTWPLYRIAPELRDKGRFSQVNLLDPGSAPRIEADIVFLRNVLIYFSNSDQQRAVATVASRIRSGGYLLTGHTERVEHGVAGLTRVASSIYRRE